MTMLLAEIGVKNIQDAEGFGIAATGLVIVFSALILVSLFIASLPRLLRVLEHCFPTTHEEQLSPQSGATNSAAAANGEGGRDDLAVVAALGFALHRRLHESENRSSQPH